MLEIERILKKAKCAITLNRAQELVKTMYQLTYQTPITKRIVTKILNMDKEQQTLHDLVMKWSKK
jgi:hypothetical protein